MIQRRRLVAALVLAGLVLLGGCVALWPFSPRPQISDDDYARIEMGMTEQQVEEYASSVLNKIPLGRTGSLDEIASAVTFLASDESSYITGIELFVDGGMTQV